MAKKLPKALYEGEADINGVKMNAYNLEELKKEGKQTGETTISYDKLSNNILLKLNE